MAVEVTGNIKLTASLTDRRTAITGAGNETGSRTIPFDAGWLVASGTAANLADRVWSNTASVADGATVTVDLAGVLTDAFGAAIVFVKLRAILLLAGSANTTTLQLARPAATGSTLFAAASDALAPLSAGGFCCWSDPAAGVAAGAGSTDLISIINSAGAAATYTVVLVGTSA